MHGVSNVFRTLGGAVLVCALAVSAAALGLARKNQHKKSETKESPAAEGARLYKRNCAVCHANDGKGGNTPSRSSLFTEPVPDLTTLAKRHGGKFPAAYVAQVLRSGVKMPDHGPSEMPVWGTIFKATAKSDEAQVTKHIDALAAYLESVQAK